IAAAKEIRKYETKAIRSHRLSMQGLINAWQEIGSINSQLASQTKGMSGTYHRVSAHALTAGLGLSHTARVEAEGRIAQAMAHRGYTPTGPAVLGQHVTIHVHGVKDVDGLIHEIDKKTKSRHQRRGTRR